MMVYGRQGLQQQTYNGSNPLSIFGVCLFLLVLCILCSVLPPYRDCFHKNNSACKAVSNFITTENMPAGNFFLNPIELDKQNRDRIEKSVCTIDV